MDNKDKKKIVFIINPVSGTQSKEQILAWVNERLDQERYDKEVVYTEYAGHAVEIAARKAAEGAFAVVAIGGDGTINEIARSLVHTETALGIIPCGSGNGLARHLQIPMEPKKAVDIINVKLGDRMLVDMLVQEPGYFYGYHITRSNWISILLDGTVPLEEICRWIDESYGVTASKKEKERLRQAAGAGK